MPRGIAAVPIRLALLMLLAAGLLVATVRPSAAAAPALASPSPSGAVAATVQQAVAGLQDSPVYVDPRANPPHLGSADFSAVAGAIRDGGVPIFLAVLPQAGASTVHEQIVGIARGLDRRAVVAVLSGPHLEAENVGVLPVGRLDQILQGVPHAGGWTRDALLSAVSKIQDEAHRMVADAPGPASAARTPQSGSGAGAGVAVLVVIAAGVGGVVWWRRRKRRAREQAELAEVRTAAEEDVTALGEDIAGLDLDVDRPGLDDATRGDYRGALDAYDRAKAALVQARDVGRLGAVSSALEEGRWRMECVRARLAGRPVPERRAPCFFNPRHGPSVTDVEWAPPGGAARQVPVCAADAERLARGQQPDTRSVLVGGSRVPYWQAGPAWGPWAGGWYGGFGGMGTGLLSGLLIGEALSGPGWGAPMYEPGLGDFGGNFGGDLGGDFGGDLGGGDFGGDFGGGDFGGDFGGGDFGGDDW